MYLWGCGSEDMFIECETCKNDHIYGEGNEKDCIELARKAGWKIVSNSECYCKKCTKGKK